MRTETYTCDVCGRSKQETNRWFRCITARLVHRGSSGSLEHGNVGLGATTTEFHLCGQECASQETLRVDAGTNPVNEFLLPMSDYSASLNTSPKSNIWSCPECHTVEAYGKRTAV